MREVNGISYNSVFYDQLPDLLLVAVKVEPLISVSHEFHTAPFEGLSLFITTDDTVLGTSATHTFPDITIE